MQQMFLRLKEAHWCIRLSQARAAEEAAAESTCVTPQYWCRLLIYALLRAHTINLDTILPVASCRATLVRCLISNHERNLLHSAHGDDFSWPAERLHFCPPMTWMICVNGSGSFRDRPCWQERQFLVLMEMPSSTTTTESETQVWASPI